MRYKGDNGFNSNSSLLLSNDAAYNGLIRVHLMANNKTLDWNSEDLEYASQPGSWARQNKNC